MLNYLRQKNHSRKLWWLNNKKRIGIVGIILDNVFSEKFLVFFFPPLFILCVFYGILIGIEWNIKLAIWISYTALNTLIGVIYRKNNEIKNSLEIDKKLDKIKSKDKELNETLIGLIDEGLSILLERNSSGKIEKVKNNLNQALFILEKSVYYKEAFKPEELFLGTRTFAVGVSSVDIAYINQPPYFLYLLEHYKTAIGKNKEVSKETLKTCATFEALLEQDKITNLRFYIYPSKELLLNREVFNTIESFCKKLNLNPFLLQSDKLIQNINFFKELKNARDKVLAFATLNNYKLPITSKENEVIPDFLINDELLTIVFQNRNGEPVYEKFSHSSEEYQMFYSLLDTLIKTTDFNHFDV